jgi:hypothetical protein
MTQAIAAMPKAIHPVRFLPMKSMVPPRDKIIGRLLFRTKTQKRKIANE